MISNEWKAAVYSADLADWVTVAAYLIAASLCAMASRAAWLTRQSRERVFWNATSVLLIFLGVNELLDLQTVLTEVGREHAKANGWYGQHRQFQYIFIVSLALMATIIGTLTLVYTRKTNSSVRVAFVGLVFIGMFVLARAASFHHFDEILGRSAIIFDWGSMQELFGIAIVASAALTYPKLRKPRRSDRF